MSSASGIHWDLDHLIDLSEVDLEAGSGEPFEALLDEADRLAGEFAGEYEGRVAELDGAGLRDAMERLARISELVGRALNFAHLAFAVDTADPEAGARVARGSERASSIRTRLLFFELEWVALSDERAERLLEADGLDFCRHHLRLERRYRDHLLSRPEEELISELAPTGAGAWSRLFDELTSAIEVDLGEDEGRVSLDQALSRLTHPSPEERERVASAVTEALRPTLRTRAYVFNTLLQDKAIKDRLRSYPHWLATRNLANEAPDEAVEALVEAVKARYELPRRWYRTKARLLGLDRLRDFDRMAVVSGEEPEVSWEEGSRMVLDTFGETSETMRAVAERFISERWIDAPPGESKRGGAFSASTVPSVHPYVMLNWTDRRRDVTTLAHELGHGIHQFLARDRGVFHQSTPLTVAETASVFAEELVLGKLLDDTSEPADRLGLVAESVEGQIATVFRQIAMNQFEHRVHTHRRESGELSVETFGELWVETQSEMLGDSVEITDGYRTWWSYVPHFIGSPGYVYAYAFGQLLALSVYRLYTERGEEIIPDYIEMLAAGGSRPPEELAAMVGVDLRDPGFWDGGLDLVEEQLGEAERAAEAVIEDRS